MHPYRQKVDENIEIMFEVQSNLKSKELQKYLSQDGKKRSSGISSTNGFYSELKTSSFAT